MRLFTPIYDTIFVFLMEDIEVARGLISLIIEEDVIELVPAPQESTAVELKIKYNQLPLLRLDYVAIIKSREVETALELEASLERYIEDLEKSRQLAEKTSAELLFQREEERKLREVALEKIKDLARFLKSMNVDISQIIEKTGLTRDEIELL